jgi:hypothetical protein
MCEHRLVLERRRVHLAVAVALEHAAQSVGDRAQLARLVWQHVTRAAGDRMHHQMMGLAIVGVCRRISGV